jgi:hypothetical protein
VGQADQEGHRQQEPLGPGQGDRGLHQKGVPRQGKQITEIKLAGLGIRDILVRIRIRGSVPRIRIQFRIRLPSSVT